MNVSTLPATNSTGSDGIAADSIVFDNVSKFYGEVLGVNRVTLTLAPGITGLVGPNGSGKTTLMNLMTGLLRPTEGTLRVLGQSPSNGHLLFDKLGYCTQFDAFPAGTTGYRFIYDFLRVHGHGHSQADALTWQALDRVNLQDAARRKVAGYSKGMRQRVRLAQAISHQPQVLVLDEPLNGLDPMARAEVIAIFRELAEQGRHIIISSHILHEVDMISDQVVLLSGGYIVADGDVSGMRTEISEHPIQVLLRCTKPSLVASKLFEHDFVVEASLHEDREGLMIRTREPDRFYTLLNAIITENAIEVETVSVADGDVKAVYRYLIGNEGEAR